jgi:ATP-dependent NAD(P)H-hydrate dehydratase
MSSLRAGSDLAYVFTAREAAPSIKSYSPELMVVPVYSAAEMDELAAALPDAEPSSSSTASDAATDSSRRQVQVTADVAVEAMVRAVDPWLDRLHCLVVGPGLGRCPLVMRAVSVIIQKAKSKNLALVVDADALFLLTVYPDAVAGYPRAVLTPNVVEYGRLVDRRVNLAGVTVIRKGRVDTIAPNVAAVDASGNETESSSGSSPALVCSEPGGLKRSGGIGDVLAGTLGTLLAWQVILHPPGPATHSSEPQLQHEEDWQLACWTACCAVRRATRYAYERHRRSMTAPDVLAELGAAIQSLEADDDIN